MYHTCASTLSFEVGFSIISPVLIGLPVRGSKGAPVTTADVTLAGLVRPTWPANGTI